MAFALHRLVTYTVIQVSHHIHYFPLTQKKRILLQKERETYFSESGMFLSGWILLMHDGASFHPATKVPTLVGSMKGNIKLRNN